MAEVQVTRWVDDMDGTDLSGLADDQVRRVRFAVGSARYEMDLTAENAALFDEDIARWVGVARRVKRARRGSAGRRGWSDGLDRQTRMQVRAWARRQGLAVSSTGRLSKQVIAAWRADQGQSASGCSQVSGGEAA
ncbi:Lsr2 dimerization domain-containing protein [Corynebacterium bovis]|uniref:Lsr2 dimerization domain-containing protein n=1 Tax=Corynebacterium bovis TaxID=36808 RepID=UPI000F6505E1|nr:histone-like nucleoid-structuring protein Lsr2 [Corynebacterium bovis]RRQ14136.1 nucleoid-associated protein Lsr2 [Corynebacterium bovis]